MTLKSTSTNEANVPVLPLRDVVVYPSMVIPLFVGREVHSCIGRGDGGRQADRSARAESPDTDDPGADDLYHIGTLATVLQL